MTRTLQHQLAEADAAALERTMASGGTTVDVDTLDRALWKALKPARALTGRTPRRHRRMATRSRARAADVYEELLAKSEARDNAASKRGRYRCLLRLGDLRRYGGDAKRATAWYERARRAEPGRGEAENGLGAVAQATGRPVTAAYLYWRGSRAARPFRPAARNFKAMLEILRGRAEDDEAASIIVLAFDGDAAAASARLADLRARKALSASRLAECEALLEHAARRVQ
ncbi:unnamed protein product [Pelagomonas calceolata]|uniref:Uncharacterized protein n=1 Tax=Pelagomonas calceolata TaxID=35677 RepID=A0A8J2SVD5_9STRA|nr:unnamed protein product [Pelagomonas calceolata]|mmetsp:Transcript_21122/g.59653  ORF Transcript_21122/g.59653 Transcript_21122/m.59653 type:complete len:229 (-) Transcript_21122:88-774(-)